MTNKKVSTTTKALTAITFLVMIVVNALANILPINGQTSGGVSDTYPNLFAPAGSTFTIWGVIYLLLAAYTLYQLGLFQGGKNEIKVELLNKVSWIFSISSIANAMWIFAWHYKLIPVATLLITVILLCLILIVLEIKKASLTIREKLFIKIPFSVYFGWITVATIANATTLLVDLGWNGFGISEPIWAAIIIAIGLLIAGATIIKNKDIAYGLVIVWAYVGIFLKHTSASGFAGQYPLVIGTVVVSITLLLLLLGYVFVSNRALSTGKAQ